MNVSMRGALIGFGFISESGHAPAYLSGTGALEGVEIVAVSDISEQRRFSARSALPGARVYEDFRDLLENESLDFVDICVPPTLHAGIARVALERGCHVLCEKPLATTVEDAAGLLKLARERRRVIFPCHNYKQAPVVKAINRAIQNGRLGKIRSLNLNTFRNTHAKGVPGWHPHWRRFQRWSGGGIAMDHGSHSFYLTFDWMGAYPVAVTAKSHNFSGGLYDTEDNFTCVLTFPDGLAHVHLTWTAGVRKVIYSVQGEKGAVTVDDDAFELALIKKTGGTDVGPGNVAWDVERQTIASQWMDASHATWFSSLFSEFKAAIEKKEYAGRDALNALLCVQIISAAYQSSRENSREIQLGAVDI